MSEPGGIDWEIRPFEPTDAEAVRRLLLDRFPSPAEADLTEALRSGGYAAVELVAVGEPGLLGYVLVSRMASPARALSLAPVATAAAHEGMGVGSSLIESALASATAANEHMVFVLGEPEYYERFGFSAAKAERFDSPYAGPYWQVTMLDEDAPRSGTAQHAEPFSALG